MDNIRCSFSVFTYACWNLWLITTDLLETSESINSSWAQVENQLQRRFDLIPNLINTVKGYVKHEKGIFEYVADARAKLAGAKNNSR